MAFKRKKSKPFRQAPKELVQGDEFEKEMGRPMTYGEMRDMYG